MPQVLDRVSETITTEPVVVEANSVANLGAGVGVNIDNNVRFAPVMDVFAFMDQAGRLQIFESIDGVTFRQVDEFPVAASVPRKVEAYRISALHGRARLINDAGAATTTLEFQVIVRSG